MLNEFLPDWNLYFILSYLLILAGLAGAVLPVVPGPSLIWLGIVLWAWADGFARLGWGVLLALGLLAALSWSLDFVLTPILSRRAGVSWRAIGGGIVGGMLGGTMLTVIPVLGTIGGALIGALLGMWVVEYNVKGSSQAASTAVQAYLWSFLLNTVLEIAIALAMIAVFAWRAFG
jgi:hypothetical protein